MILNCLVVDDEPLSIRVIEKYLKELPQFKLVASCTDAFQAMPYLSEQQIDLLFLDINMPKLSGLSLLKSLQQAPLVIITTAYPEFAVESFELEVLDYLVKPISFDRFIKATSKALRQKEIHRHLKQQTPAVSHLMVKADRKLFQLKTEQIQYLQAYGDYVKIYTKEGMFLPKETLNQIEARLPKEQFIRVHRSFVVAGTAIKYLEGNFVFIGNEKIPVGKTYRQKVLNYLTL